MTMDRIPVLPDLTRTMQKDLLRDAGIRTRD